MDSLILKTLIPTLSFSFNKEGKVEGICIPTRVEKKIIITY